MVDFRSIISPVNSPQSQYVCKGDSECSSINTTKIQPHLKVLCCCIFIMVCSLEKINIVLGIKFYVTISNFSFVDLKNYVPKRKKKIKFPKGKKYTERNPLKCMLKNTSSVSQERFEQLIPSCSHPHICSQSLSSYPFSTVHSRISTLLTNTSPCLSGLTGGVTLNLTLGHSQAKIIAVVLYYQS